MSFSGNIKEEISRQLSPARHCQIAELAAIISMCGAVMIDSRGHAALKIHTENLAVARKSFTLLRRTFNIVVDIAIRVNREKGSSYYYIVVKKHEDAIRVLQAAKLLNPYGDVEEELSVVKNVVIQETCCKRSFLRGVFLASGSMSDPEKSYHFEIVCASMGKAQTDSEDNEMLCSGRKDCIKEEIICGLSERRSSDRGCAECDGGTSVTDGVGEYPYIERYEEYGESKSELRDCEYQ